MHVDGNNQGWSYICGLGDYEGGDLWIMDDAGTVERKVQSEMSGYRNLSVGQTVRGRAVSCKNTWVKFNGNVPHATMPFTGARISIVYFSHRRWWSATSELRERLEKLGFQLPEQDADSGESTAEIEVVADEYDEYDGQTGLDALERTLQECMPEAAASERDEQGTPPKRLRGSATCQDQASPVFSSPVSTNPLKKLFIPEILDSLMYGDSDDDDKPLLVD